MNILFIGAHTDDIEHGAGGIFNKFLHDQKHNVFYLSFSRCTDLKRNKNIKEDQNRVNEYIIDQGGKILMLDFPNRKLPSYSFQIRKKMEEINISFCPNIIFTHWSKDIHQDHEIVAKESFRVFRNKTILSYECLRSCPKFFPNTFVELQEKEIVSKINLLSLYKTQKELYYLACSATRSLATIRGVAIGCKYAEAFFANRIVIGNF